MKKLAVLLGVMLIPTAALAASSRNQVLSKTTIMEDCDAVDVSTNPVCGTVTGAKLFKANLVSILVEHTGGAWLCEVEMFDDTAGAWFTAVSQAISGGIVTLSPLVLSSAGGVDLYYTLHVNHDAMRLNCSGAGTMTVNLRRSFTPDG